MRIGLMLVAGLMLAWGPAVAQQELLAQPARDAAAVQAIYEQIGAASPIDAFVAGSFRHADGALPYRLLKPAVVEKGKRYPLVMVLHGSGAIGTDNRAHLGMLARSWGLPEIRRQFPAYVLVPQFAERSANYSVDSVDGGQSSQGSKALDAALALVEQLAGSESVDRERIYVTGFSMGGSTAWHALIRRPGLFAAAVPFSGVAPSRSFARQLAASPVLVVHGNADGDNPIESDRLMYAALQNAGASKVRFREYQGMDHMVPVDMLSASDWRAWLFAQRRPAPRE